MLVKSEGVKSVTIESLSCNASHIKGTEVISHTFRDFLRNPLQELYMKLTIKIRFLLFHITRNHYIIGNI